MSTTMNEIGDVGIAPGQVVTGNLRKMLVRHTDPISYHLPVADHELLLNPLLGRSVKFVFGGRIHCTHCGRKTNKSFSQGHCYPCFKSLARCDQCIMSPEKCHYHLGTCREPNWAEQFCMSDHIIYLANSSGAKVGITRVNQVPIRWIDQGAVAALPFLRVQTRQQAGIIEDYLRQFIADKTNWRTMLKGNIEDIDLLSLADDLWLRSEADINDIAKPWGDLSVQRIAAQGPTELKYPVQEYPSKITTHNFDKAEEVNGRLMGIKGQYLILDTGVINIRKFTGYEVSFNYI